MKVVREAPEKRRRKPLEDTGRTAVEKEVGLDLLEAVDAVLRVRAIEDRQPPGARERPREVVRPLKEMDAPADRREKDDGLRFGRATRATTRAGRGTCRDRRAGLSAARGRRASAPFLLVLPPILLVQRAIRLFAELAGRSPSASDGRTRRGRSGSPSPARGRGGTSRRPRTSRRRNARRADPRPPRSGGGGRRRRTRASGSRTSRRRGRAPTPPPSRADPRGRGSRCRPAPRSRWRS